MQQPAKSLTASKVKGVQSAVIVSCFHRRQIRDGGTGGLPLALWLVVSTEGIAGEGSHASGRHVLPVPFTLQGYTYSFGEHPRATKTFWALTSKPEPASESSGQNSLKMATVSSVRALEL